MRKGFTFNAIHSRDMNIKGIRVQRNIVPETKTQVVSIPRRSQPYVIVDESYEVEEVGVECFLDLSNDSPYEVGRQLTSWLKTNSLVDMVFDDDPAFTYKAICTSAVTIQDLRNPIVTINFILARSDTP